MADQSAPSSPPPQHVFVYGNSRPDVHGAAEAPQGIQAKRAWLLGSRLYSFKRGGVQSAAVRLDESGHAVLGYAVPLKSPHGVGGLLNTLERQEFPGDHYERDVVEAMMLEISCVCGKVLQSTL